MKDKKLKEILQAIINDLKHKKEALAIPETYHIVIRQLTARVKYD